jgi:hypothetical protein
VESLNLFSQHFNEDIMALFRYILISTYFSVGGQFYEQTDGVAMGSLLSLVITNFFMEDLEWEGLSTSYLKTAVLVLLY